MVGRALPALPKADPLTPRTRYLAVVAIGGLLAVTACGSSTKKATTTDALSGVKVVGSDPKKAPVVTLTTKPLSVTKTTTQVLKAGTGATLTDKDIASLSMEVVNGKDGKAVNSNFETGAAGLFLGDANLLKGLKTGVTGQKVGSRLLVAVPPADGFGAQGNTQLGIGATDTMLFVIDVASASKMLDQATGSTVAPKAGLPTVVYNTGKAATITIPKGAKPPAKTIIQPLIQGSGATIKAGMTVRATYTGVLWRNGKMFDNAWAHDPAYFEFPAAGQGAIAAWSNGVVGQKVGSRLELVVAPADGYGAAGQGDIKGTDTMVFVMDILAAY